MRLEKTRSRSKSSTTPQMAPARLDGPEHRQRTHGGPLIGNYTDGRLEHWEPYAVGFPINDSRAIGEQIIYCRPPPRLNYAHFALTNAFRGNDRMSHLPYVVWILPRLRSWRFAKAGRVAIWRDRGSDDATGAVGLLGIFLEDGRCDSGADPIKLGLPDKAFSGPNLSAPEAVRFAPSRIPSRPRSRLHQRLTARSG